MSSAAMYNEIGLRTELADGRVRLNVTYFDPHYELPDYGLLNGRISLASADNSWIVSLFGNNLTDEVYANYATRFGGGFRDFTPPWVQPDIQQYERSALGNTMGRTRELGVSFQYNFGRDR